MVRKKCRCGKREREIQCYKEFQCDVKCAKLRDCAVHQCKRKVSLDSLCLTFCVSLRIFWCFRVFFLVVFGSIVIFTNATDCLEKLISGVIYYVLSEMLNFTLSCIYHVICLCSVN